MPSQILFPLHSNAAALLAGSGVAGIRRRILASAVLHDEVVLEDGLYRTVSTRMTTAALRQTIVRAPAG